jgi:hypothetical protein
MDNEDHVADLMRRARRRDPCTLVFGVPATAPRPVDDLDVLRAGLRRVLGDPRRGP